MKILHIGDVHLGKRQYRSDIRYQDHFDVFSESIDIALDIGVDAVIQTGDLFDISNPSIDTISKCIDTISELNEENIPFYAIVGNHERKQKEQWLDIITQLNNVHHLSTDPTTVSTDTTSVSLYGIDAVRKPRWDSSTFKLTENTSDHTIVCMHELISPPIDGENIRGMETYTCADVLEKIQGLTVDVLSLGDFHVPVEDTVDDTFVYYAGALERTSKSQTYAVVSLLNISESSIQRENINLSRARPFVKAELHLEQSDTLSTVHEKLSDMKFSSTGDKSSVGVVTVKGEDAGVTISDIEDIVWSLGAEVVEVQDKRETLQAQIDMSSESIESDTETVDSKIENSLSDKLELDGTEQEIESLVRESDLVDSKVTDEVKNVINQNEGDLE